MSIIKMSGTAKMKHDIVCQIANQLNDGDPYNVNDNPHAGQRGGKSEWLNKSVKLRKFSFTQKIALFFLKCLGIVK